MTHACFDPRDVYYMSDRYCLVAARVTLCQSPKAVVVWNLEGCYPLRFSDDWTRAYVSLAESGRDDAMHAVCLLFPYFEPKLHFVDCGEKPGPSLSAVTTACTSEEVPTEGKCRGEAAVQVGLQERRPKMPKSSDPDV